MSDVTQAATSAPPPVTASASAAPPPPWYQGKADQEVIGHWENKGWPKDDPATIAIDATRRVRELERHYGVPAEQLLKLPNKPDDAAAWSSIYQRLGMPKEAKEYDFSSIKFADGSELDDTFSTVMRDALHKAHVSKDTGTDVVKAVVKWFSDIEAAESAERAATLKTERDALTKEWGKDFEYNRLTAQTGVRRLGLDPDTVAKLESVVGYSKVMEMFRRIGAGTSEDTFVTSAPGGAVTTVNGAAARVEELRSDSAFVAKYLAGDISARREMDNLLVLLHGET
jgi:hypothetical protein